LHCLYLGAAAALELLLMGVVVVLLLVGVLVDSVLVEVAVAPMPAPHFLAAPEAKGRVVAVLSIRIPATPQCLELVVMV
jgi:hypothetical protein